MSELSQAIRNRVTEMRVVPASELQGREGNWRTHPRFQRDALRGVLESIGIAGALTAFYSEVQGGLTLIDGHLRKEDYPDTGWPTLILDVNDAEADVLLATLDPIAALAEAESSALDALLRTVETESEAVKALLKRLAEQEGIDLGGEPVADPGAQVDRAAELQEKWQVEPGDLWEIGAHRLICGDCTDGAVVARVMGGEKAQLLATDPPYGVGYSGGSKTMYYSGGRHGIERQAIAGDSSLASGMELIGQAVGLADCDTYFVWCAPHFSGEVKAILGARLKMITLICWAKSSASFAAMNATYKPQYELAWIYKKDKVIFYGPANETTLWNCDRPARNEYHPTQKPVELFCRAVKNHTRQGGTVYDPFLGSGTTMVACEQLHRRCFGIEILPKYCSVTLERLAGMGLEPRRAE